ncbi:MAG: hypothetical protein E6G82_01495 [Alphaproteobacteria bacterium]|nr:MAG: hypothetical protein E6G82_01495 [Alphaproteobacteria bacterium]
MSLVRVQHRHIIYVQGYDPRGLAQYYRMFRTELRKFGRLYRLTATISRPQSTPDGETASWTIETKASEWQTRTSYDFLRFEDLIQRDLAAPIWSTVFQAVLIYWRLVFSGTIARFWKAHWRFATFITYPHFLLLIEAMLALGLAFAFEKGLEAIGIPKLLAIAAAATAFVTVLGSALKYTENATYLLYLWKSSWSATVRARSWAPKSWHARSSWIRIWRGMVRALSCLRSEAISRSSGFMPCPRTSAITFACWRSSLRSTGSTASRARM